MAAIFVIDSPWLLLASGAVIFASGVLSGLSSSFLLRGLRFIWLFAVCSFCFNIFFVQGDVVWSWGTLKITEQGICSGSAMALRLLILVLLTSLLSLTTSPILLTDGMEKLLEPGRCIGIPAHELAMVSTIALRFVPTLAQETERIVKAQLARGAALNRGGPIQRAKALLPIMIPLFVSAFSHAEDLALAMEARCYRGGQGRTRLRELCFSGRDWIALGVAALFWCMLKIVEIFCLSGH